MFVAVALFGCAVLLGASMATLYVRKGRNPPIALAAVHGMFIAAGFVSLVVAAVTGPAAGAAIGAIGILAFPAVAGAYLISVVKRGKTLSLQHVMIHGLFALVAYAALIALAIGKG